MKSPSPEVVQALQNCLRFERTQFEYFHDQEHAFERNGWTRLEKLFDKEVDRACKRRHGLIKRIYEYDEIPNPDSETYSISFVPSEVFQMVLDYARESANCYGDSIKVLFDDGVYGKPIQTLTRNLSCTQRLILRCETELQKIKSLGGDAEYLAEQF